MRGLWKFASKFVFSNILLRTSNKVLTFQRATLAGFTHHLGIWNRVRQYLTK